MTSHSPGSALTPVFLKVTPEDIVRLKFVLESYEHLGVLRTLRRDDGIVVILGVLDTARDLEALLHSLENELRMHRLSPDDLRTLGVAPPEENFEGPWDDKLWLVET